jgi:hypothetical protein
MENDSPPARDGLIAKIRESPTAQLWVVAAGAVAFFLVFKIAGMLGDCGPNDHDGQCGMGAFMGEAFGAFGAIIIWIGLSARILWAQSRWKRGRKHQRLHSDDIVSSMPDHAAALFQNRIDDDVRRDANRRQ